MAVGFQVFLYKQKKRKKGEGERESARKNRENARNSDFNIIFFLLYSFFLFSPFAFFCVLSPPLAIKMEKVIITRNGDLVGF
jgi:cell division septal protein FtsQ